MTPSLSSIQHRHHGHQSHDRREPAQPDTGRVPDKQLLTVEEAAYIMSIGRTMTYELVNSGQLTSVLIGRSRRVPLSAIEAFIHRLIAEQGGDA